MQAFSERELVRAAAKRAGVTFSVADSVLTAFKFLACQEIKARHDVRLAGIGRIAVIPRRAGFGGHRVVLRPSLALAKSLKPRQPSEKAQELAMRLQGALSAGGGKARRSRKAGG